MTVQDVGILVQSILVWYNREKSYYEYLKRQHYLATHMELTEENVIRVLEELLPYIEADGGSLQLVEIEEETGYVKVRLGGACETCAMSVMTLKQGIEKKLMMEIPDVKAVIQVL